MQYRQIKEIPLEILETAVSNFLFEDMPNGDITTDSIFSNELVNAYLQTEEDITLCGTNLLKFFFGSNATLLCNEGDVIHKNTIFAKINTTAKDLLRKERTILNLIQRMSGIASLTKKYVTLANPYNVKILDTRKTIPGLRLFDKYAVNVGGGTNHRLNLSEGVMLKDNHIASAGSISEAVKRVRANKTDVIIEVEVENINQIEEAINANIDWIMLDNMSPDLIAECVKKIKNLQKKEIFIEASGGINLTNIHGYLTTGINAISVGALTHSAPNANIHLEIEK